MLTKSEHTIGTILDAAATLFLDKSYADVTMSDIGRVAGLTKGALYHHFTSKDQLYRALLLRDFTAKRDLFAAATEAPGSCRDRLALLTRAFLELPREHRRLMRLVRRDINSFVDPLREELVRAYQDALPNQVESIIRDGLRDGELEAADPRILAWHFVAMVEVVLSDHADRTFADIDTKLNYVLNLFLDGATKRTNGTQV